ncbi:MAG: M42 family metallopeptidase [Fervidobacterium sp.]
MESKDLRSLIELCSVPGVSGREEMVRSKIIQMLGESGVQVDRIGNLIYKKEGSSKNKNVILMAHMDEIGFYISSIREDGKLEVKNVGGIIEEVIQGTFVDVITENGVVEGVIGTVPPHLKSDGIVFEKVIDVGAHSKQEVEHLGISIMDYAVFKKQYAILNNEFLSMRSLDDRFGCYTLIEVAKNSNVISNCFFTWTVQEEVGLRGAKALVNYFTAFENTKFDLAIAVDSFACCSKLNRHINLGNGPVIRAFDNSSISDRSLVKFLIKLAQQEGIPIQLGSTGGGNDASVFAEHGVPMIALSVPIRYLHSQVEMLNVNDLKNLIKLLRVFLERF